MLLCQQPSITHPKNLYAGKFGIYEILRLDFEKGWLIKRDKQRMTEDVYLKINSFFCVKYVPLKFQQTLCLFLDCPKENDDLGCYLHKKKLILTTLYKLVCMQKRT